MPRKITKDELKAMSLEEAQRRLGNLVYEAAGLIEKLEQVGKAMGNGHHARQKIAQFAQDDLAKRWIHAADQGTTT